ncbi:MAG: hypothetical protein C0594_12855 [Marinilabiliales bacterium]|nr:MAG: hypothetical protein C0594_12855 [Marinilabiliales bacterium]
MKKQTAKDLIISTLIDKSRTKQIVYENTIEVFSYLKEALKDICNDYNKQLKKVDKRLLLEYKDRGAFETELKVAGDLIIYNMHTNVFEFDKGHGVWKTSYLKNDALSSYCGVINIYNFLADSFKYNRVDDLGYLIGRIYINKERHYFVEGKRQLGYLYNNFGEEVITKEAVKNVIESSILYCLDFDLLIPPYDSVKITSVANMKENINKSKNQTGKRLGFQFYVDDDKA